MSPLGRPPASVRAILVGGLLVWLVLAGFPFLWMAAISLRQPVDAFAVPPKLLAPVTLAHYAQIWLADRFWLEFLNSAIVTVGSLGVSPASRSPATTAGSASGSCSPTTSSRSRAGS